MIRTVPEPKPIEIEDRPWGLGLLLVGFAVKAFALLAVSVRDGDALLAAAALIFLLGSATAARRAIRISRLTLRADGSAHLAIHDRNGWHKTVFAPGTLRAGLETHRDDGGISGRVMLLIDEGDGVARIPFTGHFSAPRRARETVARIAAWRDEADHA